jgi:hypothetical protein
MHMFYFFSDLKMASHKRSKLHERSFISRNVCRHPWLVQSVSLFLEQYHLVRYEFHNSSSIPARLIHSAHPLLKESTFHINVYLQFSDTDCHLQYYHYCGKTVPVTNNMVHLYM